MSKTKCYCGGVVSPLAKPGRVSPYKGATSLEIPADFLIPTCKQCGEEWIDYEMAIKLDKVLEVEYRKTLFDSEQLDPGIRRVVLALRALGFKTTDSGDGVSKSKDGYDWYEKVPHVYICVEPRDLIASAHQLKVLVESWGCSVTPLGPEEQGVSIQCTYDPADNSAIIALFGLSDKDLE